MLEQVVFLDSPEWDAKPGQLEISVSLEYAPWTPTAGSLDITASGRLGRLSIAQPALAPEHREGFITVDRRFLPSNDTFMIRTRPRG